MTPIPYGTILRARKQPDFLVMIVQHPAPAGSFYGWPAYPEHFAIATALTPFPGMRSRYAGRTGWGDEGHTARLQLFTYENSPLGEPNYEIVR